jgi:hypothetical protein
MTISVRNSRQFKAGPISLVALSKAERWPFPVSLRKLCAPIINKPFPNWNISAGDVAANGTFTISSRGAWSATASVHDSGTFAGDAFVLDLMLVGTPGVGTSFKQALDKNQTVNLSASGSDPFVRDNFSQLNALQAHLHVAPDILGTISGVVTYLLQGSGNGDDDPDNGGSGDGGSGDGGSGDD